MAQWLISEVDSTIKFTITAATKGKNYVYYGAISFVIARNCRVGRNWVCAAKLRIDDRSGYLRGMGMWPSLYYVARNKQQLMSILD